MQGYNDKNDNGDTSEVRRSWKMTNRAANKEI